MLPAAADLAWLIGDAPVPPGRLSTAMERAGAVAMAVAAWQILPWTAARVREAAVVEDAAVRVLADAELAIRLHVRLQEWVVLRLTAALDAADVPFVLLKGAALRRTCWPEPEHRASWDIDVGVAREHLSTTEGIARGLGFSPAIRERRTGRFVPAPRIYRAILESGNHELCAMVREARVSDLTGAEEDAIAAAAPALGTLLWDRRTETRIVRSAIDIHHGLDPELSILPVLRSAERRDGRPVPSRAWATVHAARTLYRQLHREGPRLLHALADLHRLVRVDDLPAFAAELRDTCALNPIPSLARLLDRGPPNLPALLQACARPDQPPRVLTSLLPDDGP